MKGFTTAAVLMALAALSVGAAGAHANSSQQLPTESDSHTGGGGGGGGGSSSCEFPHWSKAPRIVVHTAQFNRGGAQPGDEADMVNAVQQVANEFSDTPDLSARITSVTTTTDPYYYGVWVNDSVPTIHVRFSPESAITDDNHGEAAAGLTTPNIDWAKCTISEAHIEFAQPFDTAWNYGTPEEAKVPWYDTSELVGTDTWFRPSFLHELLHAFGFKHTTNHYSFMNHRFPAGFPWAGGHDNGVRMLPWEVGVLRDAYGDTGSDFGIGLRNTWYGTPQPNDDAASQEALCPDSSVWNDTTNRCKTSSERASARSAPATRSTPTSRSPTTPPASSGPP